jgi:neurotransmitter:Na+ symporter, NSS family
VAYFVEELRLPRKRATIFAAVMITVLGVFCTLSFGIMSDVKFFGLSFFDLMDFTASNILLPLGGFFIVMFVGWYLGSASARREISNEGTLKTQAFSGIYVPCQVCCTFRNYSGVYIWFRLAEIMIIHGK